MPTTPLQPQQLRLTIDPGSLGFQDTTELLAQPVPWIGQERAEKAARFGMAMDQPDYHLFVLGEVGSGRSTLLRELAHSVATTRPVPIPPSAAGPLPHNFATRSFTSASACG